MQTVKEDSVKNLINRRMEELENTGKASLRSDDLHQISLFSNLEADFLKRINSPEILSVTNTGLKGSDMDLYKVYQSKNSLRINQYLLKILKEHSFSNEFCQLILDVATCSTPNTIALQKDRRQVILLYSTNYYHELEKFIKIAKKDYNATIFKGSTNYRDEAINITLGLDYQVKDIDDFDKILKI